jgi:hypothetical protein
MMKKQLKNSAKLPPISKEDSDFALKVVQEYSVPFDILSIHIRDLRQAVDEKEDWKIKGILPEYPFPESIMSKTIYNKYEDVLFAPGAEIKSFTISTTEGVIKIGPNDPFFDHLALPILKLQQESLIHTQNDNDSLVALTLDGSVRSLIYFLMSSGALNAFQTNVVLGMCLVHFKLIKNKPIMTEQEWLNNRTEAQDYNHYLNDVVKSRLKKFFKI